MRTPWRLAELGQLRHARHGAVVVHDFADHAALAQTGEPRQIDRRFGLPGADQHAAFARPQGKDMAGTSQIAGLAGRIDGDADGVRAVGRGDAGGDALGRFDGFAKRRAETRVVARRHGRQLQRVADFGAERKADQAARVPGHEVDDFGRDLFGGDGEVAFVFAIFIVDDDQHPAGPKILDRFGDGGERHGNTRIAGAKRERSRIQNTEVRIQNEEGLKA